MRRMKLTVILGSLLAGTVLLTTGCAQPDDGTKIEKSSNNNNNENEKPGKTYEAPTNIELSNGYSIRQFMGSGKSIAKETAVNDVNHYLGEAETYIKGLVNEFEQSTNGNAYFNDFINGYKDNDFYKINSTSSAALDYVVQDNAKSYKYILKDIIKNLENEDIRFVFYDTYNTLANEAYIKGFGSLNTNNDWYTAYEDEKNKLSRGWELDVFDGLNTEKFDLYDDVNNNKSAKLTGLMDELLGQAAGKGTLANVSQADLKKVINISLTTNSLGSIHDGEKSLLQHTERCTLEKSLSTEVRDSVKGAMYNAILETTKTQTQDVVGR